MNAPGAPFRLRATVAELEPGAMAMLGKLDGLTLGAIAFETPTGWERHGRDELLVIIDGAVRVDLEDGTSHQLAAGDAYVVPAGMYHHQEPQPRVALMFATHVESTDYREA